MAKNDPAAPAAYGVLQFRNEDTKPKKTRIFCAASSAPEIMAWYGAFHAGDNYSVQFDGRPVEKDQNGAAVGFEPAVVDPPAIDAAPCCKDCRFASVPHAGTVECRRFPPQPFMQPGKLSRISPRVGVYFWCGEFAPVVEKQGER